MGTTLASDDSDEPETGRPNVQMPCKVSGIVSVKICALNQVLHYCLMSPSVFQYPLQPVSRESTEDKSCVLSQALGLSDHERETALGALSKTSPSSSALTRLKKNSLIYLCSLKLPAPVVSGRSLSVEECIPHYTAQNKKTMVDCLLDWVGYLVQSPVYYRTNSTAIMDSARKDKRWIYLTSAPTWQTNVKHNGKERKRQGCLAVLHWLLCGWTWNTYLSLPGLHLHQEVQAALGMENSLLINTELYSQLTFHSPLVAFGV